MLIGCFGGDILGQVVLKRIHKLNNSQKTFKKGPIIFKSFFTFPSGSPRVPDASVITSFLYSSYSREQDDSLWCAFLLISLHFPFKRNNNK